ncbi:MAG TPA: TonB-dependent receptor [Hyphomonadaceae bacterium]|nr:TonB-dependent receptor [Hyphomonadaceae bacterium]
MAHMNRFSLVSLLALGIAMPAMAQNTPASGPQAAPQADQAPDKDRDVVVVTAQKREETVQDIAVAVTAITSQLRDEVGLTTVQDYTNFAPGLSYSTASDRLGMRGVTRTSNNFGIRSGISNYVDGVYFSSAIPASREPIFIDRVEVVRGPQGTLYGRDSIGGALNVITKRPTDDYEGQFDIGVGNYGSRKVEGTFAGPITDWLRFRVGGNRTIQDEGYLKNYAGLQTEGGRRDDSYYEAQLEGNIGDKFDWWVRAGTLSWDVRYGAPGARTGGDDNTYNTQLYPTGILGPNGFFAFSGQATNVVMTGTQTTNPKDPRGFNADFSNFAYLAPTQEYALEGTYHFDGFDVKYLGGYVWYHYNLQQDQDGSPVQSFTFNGKNYNSQRVSDYNENRAWYSNEINIVSTGDGPLNWIAGLYQYQENYTQPIYVSSLRPAGGFIQRLSDVTSFVFNNPLPDLPDFTGRNSSSGSPLGGDLIFHTNNQGLNNAYGIFFQTDYKFTDQWKVTAGLRWSKDVEREREFARLITINSTEETLEGPFGLGPFAGLVGGQAALNALIQPRIDVTDTQGGPDPTTVSASNPCGLAARGVLNANPTAANGGTGCGGHDRSRYGIYYDALTGNEYRDMAGSWSELTGTLGLDWTPDKDTLIFGKYSRGYKPGGLGCAATFCLFVPTPYADKEINDAYELGIKREWRDWNLTTNIDLFYYDYQGYQVPNTVVPEDPDGAGPLPRPPAYAAYVNLPTTKTTGIEIETIWRPVDDLRILLNYGYTDPKIGHSASLINAQDPFAIDPNAQPLGTPLANGQRGQDLDGNILPNSPKNKAAMIATYTFNLTDGSKLDATLNYSWQDIAYSSIFNTWMSKIPSWDQTDGRLTWTSSDGAFTLIGFIRNMFDEDQYDSRGVSRRIGTTRNVSPGLCGTTAANTIQFSSSTSQGTLAQDCFSEGVTFRPPRTYGAELQFHF